MSEENTPAASGVQGATRGAFTWWREKSRINPEDTFGTKVLKVLYMIGGVLFMILFSPLLLLAFVIAFLVAL